MDVPELRHRLVAILAADAVGYSRLMSVDDRKTVAALDAARAIFREEIAKAHGRVVDTAGDSVLAIFEAAVDAVAAALSIQHRLASHVREVPVDDQMHFRIGVHLGDVIEKPDASVYGDGVNIASRLQALTVGGGIVVSQSVRTAVAGRVQTAFKDLGAVAVKNIAQPIQVFQLVELDLSASKPRWSVRVLAFIRSRRGAALSIGLSLVVAILVAWSFARPLSTAVVGPSPTEAAGSVFRPDGIAVLAFANLSGDANKEYLSDGLSEELSNTLELIPGLSVIAQTSTIAFKAKPASVPEVGRLLHVAYVVEGSVRATVDRARISVRLTRATDGVTIWSESYDRALDDVIGLQTEMALVIAQKLRLQIDRARLSASRATNAQAQRLFFEAQEAIHEHTADSYDRAESLLNQALALDPNYLQAKVRLVHARWNRLHGQGLLTYRNRNSAEMLGLIATLRDVLVAAPELSEAHAELGVLFATNWQLAESDETLRRAIELNPNAIDAYLFQAKAFDYEGRVDEAIAALQHAIVIDPLNPVRKYLLADLLARAGRYADALPQVDQAIVLRPEARFFVWLKATLLSRLGRHREATVLAGELIGKGGDDDVGDWDILVRSEGRPGRERAEAWLRGPGAAPDGTVNPHLGRVPALLALDRPAEALRDIEDATYFTLDDVINILLYNPHWDAVSDSPRFREILAKLQMTDAYRRVRTWRDAHPPQR